MQSVDTSAPVSSSAFTSTGRLMSTLAESDHMTNDQVQLYPQPSVDFDTSTLDGTDGEKVVTLGLVPSPGQAERVVADIVEELPDLLHHHIDDEVTWQIKVIPDPLIGSNLETPELLNEIDEWRQPHGWSYAICLTDLPVRRDGQIVIAEASIDRNLAWISVPPLGVIQLRHRTRSAILQMMNEIRWGAPQGERNRLEEHDQSDPHSDAQRERTLSSLMSNRIAKQATPPDEEPDVDVRYTTPKVVGHARLLAGMVYANRPWRLFPSFKTTVATAFGTGGYVLIFSTVWELGNQFPTWRLATLTLVSMMILIGWITISHSLWQPHRAGSSRYLTLLYNTTTVLTITVGVIFAYTVVFLLLLGASTVFIPPDVFESRTGQPASPMSYVNIAWMGASVATIAGAIGAGLEDTDAVREATYSWRQQRRAEEYKRIWGDGQGGTET